MPTSIGAPPIDRPTRRRRPFSPLALAGMLVAILLALLMAGESTAAGMPIPLQPLTSVTCTLIVPANPLTAQGLATPYLLKPPCHEANPADSAFVQAAVVNPRTGSLAVYDPLVIDQGTRPARPPVVPNIQPGSVVGIWFGFNGKVLALQGAQQNTLTQNNCVFGLPGSPFGQFAYCNAVNFFAAANAAIKAGKLTPPPLGTDKKGLVCPSVRSFFIVDQDQSDNVTTQYLVAPNGLILQDTAANMRAFPNAMVLTNPSDNRLLIGVDAALGCTPWMAPNLANPGTLTTALPLNELQAAAHQPPPVALVPDHDPMVLVMQHGTLMSSLAKLNLYRVGVDQPAVQSLQQASTQLYCVNLQQIAPPRLATDAPLLGRGPTPDPAVGNTLFTFMAQRYVNTFTNPLGEGLACTTFGLQPHVATLKNAQGVAIAVTITVNGQMRCFNSRGMVSPMNICMPNGNNTIAS